MKSILIGCAIVVLVIVLLIVLSFYLISQPKFKNVSDVEPFKAIINRKLTSKKKTLILKYPGKPKDANYVFVLEDGTGFGMNSNLPTIVVLPIGTEVIFDTVELHTGRVSGTTSAYLFGKVYSSKTHQEYLFQYHWGHYHSLNEDKPYWTFEKAFWQDKSLDKKFHIDVP